MNAYVTIEGVRRKADIGEGIQTRELDVHARKAERGSRRLRNAIWRLQGYSPRKVEIPKEKITKAQLCPTCHAPVAPRRLIAEIQQTVGAFYGFHVTALLSARRGKDLCHARQVGMYLASELTTHSLAEIGRRFNRDHTTILHALKVVQKRAEEDEEAALNIALLRERLSA